MQTRHGLKEGKVPAVDLASEKALQDLLIDQIHSGRVAAAHDVSEGGLLVTVAEMLFEDGALGANLRLGSRGGSGRLDTVLFGESQGRVVIAAPSGEVDALIASAAEAGVEAENLGVVNREGRLKMVVGEEHVLDVETQSLINLWQNAIPEAMNRA